MKRFRWTRKKYRHAQQLSRLLPRFYVLPDDAPAIVQRYWELIEEHGLDLDDPLLIPLRLRYDPEIPF